MTTNRIVNIVLTDLSLENLMLQEELEAAINSTEGTKAKALRVKNALKELVINDQMITKFQSLIKPTETTQLLKENG